jgi:hypothetical protein
MRMPGGGVISDFSSALAFFFYTDASSEEPDNSNIRISAAREFSAAFHIGCGPLNGVL